MSVEMLRLSDLDFRNSTSVGHRSPGKLSIAAEPQQQQQQQQQQQPPLHPQLPSGHSETMNSFNGGGGSPLRALQMQDQQQLSQNSVRLARLPRTASPPPGRLGGGSEGGGGGGGGEGGGGVASHGASLLARRKKSSLSPLNVAPRTNSPADSPQPTSFRSEVDSSDSDSHVSHVPARPSSARSALHALLASRSSDRQESPERVVRPSRASVQALQRGPSSLSAPPHTSSPRSPKPGKSPRAAQSPKSAKSPKSPKSPKPAPVAPPPAAAAPAVPGSIPGSIAGSVPGSFPSRPKPAFGVVPAALSPAVERDLSPHQALLSSSPPGLPKSPGGRSPKRFMRRIALPSPSPLSTNMAHQLPTPPSSCTPGSSTGSSSGSSRSSTTSSGTGYCFTPSSVATSTSPDSPLSSSAQFCDFRLPQSSAERESTVMVIEADDTVPPERSPHRVLGQQADFVAAAQRSIAPVVAGLRSGHGGARPASPAAAAAAPAGPCAAGNVPALATQSPRRSRGRLAALHAGMPAGTDSPWHAGSMQQQMLQQQMLQQQMALQQSSAASDRVAPCSAASLMVELAASREGLSGRSSGPSSPGPATVLAGQSGYGDAVSGIGAARATGGMSREEAASRAGVAGMVAGGAHNVVRKWLELQDSVDLSNYRSRRQGRKSTAGSAVHSGPGSEQGAGIAAAGRGAAGAAGAPAAPGGPASGFPRMGLHKRMGSADLVLTKGDEVAPSAPGGKVGVAKHGSGDLEGRDMQFLSGYNLANVSGQSLVKLLVQQPNSSESAAAAPAGSSRASQPLSKHHRSSHSMSQQLGDKLAAAAAAAVASRPAPSQSLRGSNLVLQQQQGRRKSRAARGQSFDCDSAQLALSTQPNRDLRPIDYVLRKPYEDVREHYVLHKSELGSGQFGVIRPCMRISTGEVFACKIINKTCIKSAEDAEDIRKEVACLTIFRSHPAIVTLENTFEDSENIYIVMELCRGGDLFDRVSSKGRLTEGDAALLGRALVEALLHCHCLGVVHRDVKPENILMCDRDSDTRMKLVDFGVATFFEPGKPITEVLGTPEYMAPEVLLQSYGPEADIWSAGVVLYIALCGVPPFWASSRRSLAESILRNEVSFKSTKWANVSDECKDLVRRMLVKNPKQRITAPEILGHPWIRRHSS